LKDDEKEYVCRLLRGRRNTNLAIESNKDKDIKEAKELFKINKLLYLTVDCVKDCIIQNCYQDLTVFKFCSRDEAEHARAILEKESKIKTRFVDKENMEGFALKIEFETPVETNFEEKIKDMFSFQQKIYCQIDFNLGMMILKLLLIYILFCR
jgi:hypothetical protein